MSLATEVIRLQGPLAADALVGKFRLDVPAQVGISAGHELGAVPAEPRMSLSTSQEFCGVRQHGAAMPTPGKSGIGETIVTAKISSSLL